MDYVQLFPIGMLLSVIAVFLGRLLRQFDNLTREMASLNSTMTKIDKDLSNDIGILKSKVTDLDEMWSRIRATENDVIALQSGGCIHRRDRQ